MLDELFELLTGQDGAPLAMVATFPAAFQIAEPKLVVIFCFVPIGEIGRGEIENVFIAGDIDGIDHGELHGMVLSWAEVDATMAGVKLLATGYNARQTKGDNEMEGMAPLFIILFIVFVIGAMKWHYSRAERILENWARDNCYEILSKEYRWFRRGPYFWFTSRAQEVFYVTVRSQDGKVRRGWVLCGGWFLGMLSGAADVEWDE